MHVDALLLLLHALALHAAEERSDTKRREARKGPLSRHYCNAILMFCLYP
jgi:hypothetical protein